ncbi:MAG: SsrA-binding protein SmpB [Alphaproteobacteria bacterium]|nr:SsrA-binding protein SmpB [Alphaproteobacteria bacterium]
MNKRRETDKFVAQNRRAFHEYTILDKIEAGIVLLGSEVKALRLHNASLAEAWAGERNGALVLWNAFIPHYRAANRLNHEERRPRQLLLHRRQMSKMLGRIRKEGITLVPLSLYFNERGLAKVELGLAKGRNQADKRAAIKERDWQRDKRSHGMGE